MFGMTSSSPKNTGQFVQCFLVKKMSVTQVERENNVIEEVKDCCFECPISRACICYISVL